MANIEDQIRSARTIEDIVNLLSILYTNLNNQNEIYYNMFLNPIPMDLELQRYDENGELETVTLANRAKDRISSYSGVGSPEGIVLAGIGATYIDTSAGNFYYKITDSSSANGWVLIYSTKNFDSSIQYLTPTGDASGLQNIDANAINAGTVKVVNGGTGRNSLESGRLLKGNGTSNIAYATAGVDYMVPNDMCGMIMYCPFTPLPTGLNDYWLLCDGTVYTVSERPALQNLCAKLGNKYGGNGTTTFGVPSLTGGRYIKGGIASNVGHEGNAAVGTHTHPASKVTTTVAGEHAHNRGNMNITGTFRANDLTDNTSAPATSGAFYAIQQAPNRDASNGKGGGYGIGFNAASGWTGNTNSTGSHSHDVTPVIGENAANVVNEVNHVVMAPLIHI